MTLKAAGAIGKWVGNGGVLLLMANDIKNGELDSFNLLALKFGMQFIKTKLYPVKFNKWQLGVSANLPDHQLFKNVNKIFLKEMASIICTKDSKSVYYE